MEENDMLYRYSYLYYFDNNKEEKSLNKYDITEICYCGGYEGEKIYYKTKEGHRGIARSRQIDDIQIFCYQNYVRVSAYSLDSDIEERAIQELRMYLAKKTDELEQRKKELIDLSIKLMRKDNG
jgi:hypothetical protein